jgi:hypothetical protein
MKKLFICLLLLLLFSLNVYAGQQVYYNTSCWYCSGQHATVVCNYNYDSFGYFRYNNSCSCPIFGPGCGAHGSTSNWYCNICTATLPPPYTPTYIYSSKTSWYGITTVTLSCSRCGYYTQYSY